MQRISLTILCTALVIPAILADPADEATKAPPTQKEIAEGLTRHGVGAEKLAAEQDELSADVQDLIDEQTDAEVIGLLRQIELIMADATDQLALKKTDGSTIATETEIIEKIFEAAKKKQQKQGKGKGKGKSSMLEMMKRMMDGGRDVGKSKKPGKKPGGKPGDKPGQGGNGGGEAGGKTGDPDNTAENSERRVPKNSGSSGSTLPREFQKAMDAYNRGAAKKSNHP